MRLLYPAAALVLLAGCATRPPPHIVVRHPNQVHPPATAHAGTKPAPTPAPEITAEPVAATLTAAPAAKPTAAAPASAIPLMGFRPLRGQGTQSAGSGA